MGKDIQDKNGRAMFRLVTSFNPCGDQPKAIEELVKRFNQGIKSQTLLGVTGSGKTFTMANVIQKLGKKTLILAHNKSLAAQLYSEFKDFFPENAVEFFISYYDYYQPEAYVPSSDTYIEKDSAINEEIDRLRHSATKSLLERDDVIVVASVSCIYGIGSPEDYENLKTTIYVGEEIDRDEFLKALLSIQYARNDFDFSRGTFRVRGDIVEVFPASEESHVIRIEFFDQYVENISIVDPLRGRILYTVNHVIIFPKSHYVVSDQKLQRAIKTIKLELRQRLKELKDQEKLVEHQRLEQRTMLDLEMLEEMGFCTGIENYSRHLTGQEPGLPPATLIDFFKKDFLMIIDESHISLPQVRGMFLGDRSRKQTLVDYGFRLPSALDNRPLNFSEFETKLDKVLYVSATPADYELQKNDGEFVEQVIRPTGLLDPMIEVKDAKNQVDDCLLEVRKVIKSGFRVLITTLTKKLSEELTKYYHSVGIKIRYLHSDISAIERVEILRDLRLGEFDVLVGINLLREGLDLPEVALVAILDADKEGFLRSTRSLIQTIGRAARNDQGRVIMYAYKTTESMKRAIDETQRRRQIQSLYNQKHGITPQTIQKKISGGVIDSLKGRKKSLGRKAQAFMGDLTPENLDLRIKELKILMQEASRDLRFEDAAKFRDEIRSLSEARMLL